LSYTLVVYLLDLDELRRAVGSRDEALLSAVIADDPEAFEPEEPDPDDREEIPPGEALRHLVMGEKHDPGSAHQYGYALEHLCRHLGRRLEGGWWESIRWTVLQATGMEEILAGPPVPLPPNDSFPVIGFLTPEQVRPLAEKLREGPLKTAASSGRRRRRGFREWMADWILARITHRQPMTDEDVREGLDEYGEWLRTADSEGKSLVFFYY
jgi:hypothetical protein